MAHSRHRPWKGDRVDKPHKHHGHGRAWREPWPVLRKIGRRRRIRRRDLGDAGE